MSKLYDSEQLEDPYVVTGDSVRDRLVFTDLGCFVTLRVGVVFNKSFVSDDEPDSLAMISPDAAKHDVAHWLEVVAKARAGIDADDVAAEALEYNRRNDELDESLPSLRNRDPDLFTGHITDISDIKTQGFIARARMERLIREAGGKDKVRGDAQQSSAITANAATFLQNLQEGGPLDLDALELSPEQQEYFTISEALDDVSPMARLLAVPIKSLINFGNFDPSEQTVEDLRLKLLTVQRLRDRVFVSSVARPATPGVPLSPAGMEAFAVDLRNASVSNSIFGSR